MSEKLVSDATETLQHIAGLFFEIGALAVPALLGEQVKDQI